LRLALLALAMTGCSASSDDAGAIPPFPDAANEGGGAVVEAGQTVDVQVAPADREAGGMVVFPGEFTTEGSPMRLLAEGDSIKLQKPVQGGHIVLLGAQVENFPTDAANLHVRVRHEETGLLAGEEARTVTMVAVGGNSSRKQPDLRSQSQFANVPLCPDYDAIDVGEQRMLVEIEITALYTDPPLVGVATLHLVPSCSSTDVNDRALCQCECQSNYALGKCASAMPSSDAAPTR
jgi:acyl-CoA hydrolase